MQFLDEIGLVAGGGGYNIAENHDSGVARAGLQAGDLVKFVNGQPVGDVDSDWALYDEVANSGLARVEIERDGQSILLSFPLQ
ncbi:MAG: general secretion pathway protein C [Paracoccaceae bacterium]|jgi:general secretion pathway protein C